MKNIFLIILLVISCKTTEAQQPYTNGGYGQMYWDWRPDISDSCYEFTFINYKYTDTFAVNNDICPAITLYFWDDCNFGKSYINANGPAATYSNIPLHATLLPTTPNAIPDIFCGYPIIYHYLNFAQVKTPHRSKVVYKGVLCLPEKCKNWHFALGGYYDQCQNFINSFTRSTHIVFNHTVAFPLYKDTLSNLDSISYNTYAGYPSEWLIATCGFYGCSFNNVDYPNNSSPRFLSPPMYSFQLHQSIEFNPGLYDPDHDSIDVRIADTLKDVAYLTTFYSATKPFNTQAFSLTDYNGNPYSDIMTYNWFYAPVPGATGPNPQRYTPDNPFDTDSTFNLDHRTGKTTFKANSIMEPALFYSAKDYRNNTFVSESYCVGQFTILNDARLPSYIRIDTTSMKGAAFNGQGRIKVCAGYAASFDAYVKLPNDPSGDLIVKTTADTTVPGNGACTFIGQHTDSVRLHFTWTPPPGTRGLYNVFVSAKDSNCNAPYHEYMQIYTWDFDVDTCNAPLNLIPVIKEEGSVMLYPNPASNKLSVTSDENFSSVKIYNSLSELVYEKKVKSTKLLDINTSNLSAGIYLVNVDGKYIRKLVIEK